MLELVANEGVEESDDKVEDHGEDAPLPDHFDEGLFLGVELVLRLEQCLFLHLDCVAYTRSPTWCEAAQRVENACHHVLREGHDDEDDLY